MLKPDDKFGRRIICSLIGTGGMGRASLGEDSKIERPVALKVLLPHVAAGFEETRRFIRQAKAASARSVGPLF
ncbi:MAG: hypothetical protein R2747_12640 [Pyrinomonadaceae bacterium]